MELRINRVRINRSRPVWCMCGCIHFQGLGSNLLWNKLGAAFQESTSDVNSTQTYIWGEFEAFQTNGSGLSRISQRGCQPEGGVGRQPIICSKCMENWMGKKNIDRGCASKILQCRSATEGTLPYLDEKGKRLGRGEVSCKLWNLSQ